MKNEDKLLIKARILSEIDSAHAQIIDLDELTQPIAPDDAIGRISRMEAINNKSVNEHLLDKTRLRLKKLERALTLLGKTDYGNCTSCKKPIPIGRLMMLPESKKCVNCA
ncbi:MAG: conjugal transfer protein TraR [Candidatus Marinimicrobia bacterium]|nr:conjugal transfer protein TraR [Candidatus Neomarinimicrobiota bacterium]